MPERSEPFLAEHESLADGDPEQVTDALRAPEPELFSDSLSEVARRLALHQWDGVLEMTEDFAARPHRTFRETTGWHPAPGRSG